MSHVVSYLRCRCLWFSLKPSLLPHVISSSPLPASFCHLVLYLVVSCSWLRPLPHVTDLPTVWRDAQVRSHGTQECVTILIPEWEVQSLIITYRLKVFSKVLKEASVENYRIKFDGKRSNVHNEESSGRLSVTKLTDSKVRIKILEEMHFTILINCILIVIEIYKKNFIPTTVFYWHT